MIIFFDIDGTLISDGSTIIPDSAKKAINSARRNGHICMINTGRTKALVGDNIRSQVEFDGFLLGCGTMIEFRNEIVFHKKLSHELSLRIMNGILEHGIDAILEGPDSNFCVSMDRIHTETFRNYIARYATNYSTDYEAAVDKFDKFFCYADDLDRIESLKSEFEEELDFIDRENGYFEVVPKGCSKASSIEYLADVLGVDMSDTVAVGDSNNDLPMLECVGKAIAMEKSAAAVLDMAAYITTDVHNDGIWNALKWVGAI